MENVVDYLSRLYRRIEPQRVVEVGSDPKMTIIAKTGYIAGEVSVVDFKELNDYKRAWWELHREMGDLNLTRIDCNACQLDKFISEADVVYFHNVLIELEQGDTKKMFDLRDGKIEMTEGEEIRFNARFGVAANYALENALNIAPHVVWFSRYNGPTGIENYSRSGVVKDGVVEGSYGEFNDFYLNYWHFQPPFFEWNREQMFFNFISDKHITL